MQLQQLLKLLLTELLLNLQVIAFHPRTHVDKALLPLPGESDEHPTLIVRRFPAPDDTVALQSGKNTGHARFEDARQMSQLMAFQFAVLAQDTNHPPLLLSQIMFIEQIKLHERTTIAVKAAREATGQGVPLMVDTNCAWTLSEASDEITGMLPYDPLWIEEPLWAPDDSHGLAELRRSLDIKIASGENASSVHQLLERVDSNVIDYVQPSVIKVGLTAAWEVSQRCVGKQIKLAPQVAFFGPGYLASLHLLAAQQAESSIERLYLELAFTPYHRTVPVIEGWVQVPDGPGFGADPDPELIAGNFSD